MKNFDIIKFGGRLITIKEVAEYLRIDEYMSYRMARKEEIPAYKEQDTGGLKF